MEQEIKLLCVDIGYHKLSIIPVTDVISSDYDEI
jgi:hypothetical protein